MALIVLVIVGAIMIMRTGNPFFFLVLFLLLLSFYIYVLFAFGNYIKLKDVELNTGSSFSNLLSIFLFWFVANLGIAYLQSGINRIIEHERMRSN